MTARNDNLESLYRRYLAAIVSYHHAAAAITGLGPTDFQALNLLDLHGRLASGTLARLTGLTTGAATRMIDRLVAGGFVRRVPDTSDRRRIFVEATGHLPDNLEATLGDVRQHVGTAFADRTPEELAILTTYFQRAADAYQDALEQLRDEEPPPPDPGSRT